MEHEQEHSGPSDWRWANRVERAFIRLAVLLAVLLAASQLALLIPAVRHILVKVERLEGRPFEGRLSGASINFAYQEDSMV